MNTDGKTLLQRRFPNAFDPGEDEEYLPVPASLIRFLRSTFRKSQHREIALALMSRLDFDGGSSATISDYSLAKRLGMNRRDVRAAANDPAFGAVISVQRGEQRRKGAVPVATVYDLEGLLASWGEFRRAEADGQ